MKAKKVLVVARQSLNQQLELPELPVATVAGRVMPTMLLEHVRRTRLA